MRRLVHVSVFFALCLPQASRANLDPGDVALWVQPRLGVPLRMVWAGDWEGIPSDTRHRYLVHFAEALDWASRMVSPDAIQAPPFRAGPLGAGGDWGIKIVLARGSTGSFQARNGKQIKYEMPDHASGMPVRIISQSLGVGTYAVIVRLDRLFDIPSGGSQWDASPETIRQVLFFHLAEYLYGEIAFYLRAGSRFAGAQSPTDRALALAASDELYARYLSWLRDSGSAEKLPSEIKQVLDSHLYQAQRGFQESLAEYTRLTEGSAVPYRLSESVHPTDLEEGEVKTIWELFREGWNEVKGHTLASMPHSFFQWKTDLASLAGKSIRFNLTSSRGLYEQPHAPLKAPLAEGQTEFIEVVPQQPHGHQLKIHFLADRILFDGVGHLRPDAFARWVQALARVQTGLVPAFLRASPDTLPEPPAGARLQFFPPTGIHHHLVSKAGHEGALACLIGLRRRQVQQLGSDSEAVAYTDAAIESARKAVTCSARLLAAPYN